MTELVDGGDTVGGKQRLQTEDTVVGRRFADRLSQEQTALSRVIRGIDRPAQRDRYAAVMIHRLLCLKLIHTGLGLPLEQTLTASQAAYPDRYYSHVLRPWFGLDPGPPHPTAPTTLFCARSIETANPGITIPDAAFARLFAMFSEFGDWLRISNINEFDSCVLSHGSLLSIAPEPVGAYYTPSDVTRYLCESAILPTILEASDFSCRRFGSVQAYSRSDRPIGDSDQVSIDDLVTWNLDLGSLTRDWLRSGAEDGAVASLYEDVLPRLAVLDPTCGTGAFLLAAADVLGPVYEACRDRLGLSCDAGEILRMIIGRSLHGVDIMDEAVEIAGLRLALRCLAVSGGYNGLLPNGFQLTASDFLTCPQADNTVDVIVGNPPYVRLRDRDRTIDRRRFTSAACGNLYAPIIERCLRLLSDGGRLGMIVQLPVVCTDRMAPLRRMLIDSCGAGWFAGFDDRPASLFGALEHSRTATVIIRRRREGETAGPNLYSAGYNRWYARERPGLFQRLAYTPVTDCLILGVIPKIGDPTGVGVLMRIRGFSPLGDSLCDQRGIELYYHNAPQYWVRAMDFIPHFDSERDDRRVSQQIKTLHTRTVQEARIITAILNSSLFYFWFIALSDCRHLNRREIDSFPLGLERMDHDIRTRLAELCEELMVDLRRNSRRRTTRYRTTGRVEYDEFHPAASKAIIDNIDSALALHYGLTAEQLRWVQDYDHRYRVGGVSRKTEDIHGTLSPGKV